MNRPLLTTLATALVLTLAIPQAFAVGPKLQYRSMANHLSRDLWKIHKVVTGKDVPGARGLLRLYQSSEKRLVHLAKACPTRFKGVADDYSAGRNGPYLLKGVACKYAVNLKAVFVEQAAAATKRTVDAQIKGVARTINKLAKGKKVYKDDLELANSIDAVIKKRGPSITALYKALGKPAPANPFARLSEAAKAIPAAVAAAAKVNHFPAKAKYKAKGAKKAFASKLKEAGFKMLKAKSSFPDWQIFRKYGVPSHKSRAGVALVKKKGEAHCRIYEMVANADYKGGGKYQKAQARLRESSRYVVSSCKKK